ncbi:MAG: type II toxin-antitoxin system HicB family antitoxin [Dehalococcoidia bacterium]
MHAEVQVVVFRENEYWVARALPVEVSSFGRSRPEALAAIREALELYFEDEDVVVSPATDATIETVLV